MYSIPRHQGSTLVSASAQWVESYFAVTRRHYKIVALCNSELLAAVQQHLQRALGHRRIKDSVTKLTTCDKDLYRLCVAFDADDSERNGLSQTVRRLCAMPGVRYVRLDPHSN